MQKLESKLLATRAQSPTGRIAGILSPDADAIEFRALSICEACGREIALGAGFSWAEWGWYRGDYNRAQAYADATVYAHDAQEACNAFFLKKS